MNLSFRRSSIAAAVAVAATLGFATSAQAVACTVNDISPTAQACAGFFNGQLLSNQAGDIAAQQAALTSIGFVGAFNFNSFEKLSGLNSATTVNFATALNGITFIGLHFGNGQNGPGNSTAFYRFDAGTNLDTFKLAFNASSDAILYSTMPAVPEPETYALLLAGLGVVGFVSRRRRPNA